MINKEMNESVKKFKNILKFSKIITILYIGYIFLNTVIRILIVYFDSGSKYINLMIISLIFMIMKIIGSFILIKLLESAMKFFDNIINNKIFSKVVIKQLDEMVKLSTIYYILWALSTLSLQVPILSIAFVIYISKEIFIYGNKLEEEAILTI